MPTYNRVKRLKKQLEDIFASTILDDTKLVVVNDCSTDATLNFLESLHANENLSIINHKRNLGYANNLIYCLKACQTEYMLWITDDDDYIFENIKALEKLIANCSLDFVSPEFDDSMNSRKNHKNKFLSYRDIWDAARHAPGLLFKRSAFIKLEDSLLLALGRQDYVAFFYPQIFLLFHAKAKGSRLLASDIVIGSKTKKALETNAIDSNGNHYLSFYNSVKLFHDFKNFYEEIYKETSSKEILEVLDYFSMSLLSYIRRGIRSDFKELERDLMIGVAANITSFSALRHIPKIMVKLSMRAIKKLFNI